MKKKDLRGNHGGCAKIAKCDEYFALLTRAQLGVGHGIQPRLRLFGHGGEKE
jgi:hypothetical protein